MRRLTLFFIFIWSLTTCTSVAAQIVGGTQKDSIKQKGLLNTDTLKKVMSLKEISYHQTRKDQIPPVAPSTQLKQITNKISQADPQITQRFSGIKGKNNNLSLDLSVQGGAQYNPLPTSALGIQVNPKFANVFSVTGGIGVWGIPFNFNFSNGHNSFSEGSDLRSSLFKFDLDQAKYRSLLQSDLQRYYNLRRDIFAGYDLTGYTQTVLKQKLKDETKDASAKGTNSVIGQYIEKPENVTSLLNMNELQIRQKLSTIAQTEIRKQAGSQTASTSIINNEQNKAITDIISDHNVAQYLNDTKNARELQLMNEQQICDKLRSLLSKTSAEKVAGNSKALLLKEDEKNNADKRTDTKEAVVKSIARQIFLSRSSAKGFKLTDLKNSVITAKGISSLTENNKVDINRQIDSVTAAISNIKISLQKNGYNISKILAIQNATEGITTDMPAEQIASGLTGNSKIGIRSLFRNVQDFKLGAYGNSVPGSTAGSDLFTQGTHITYKAGNIPITLGYGNVNDISSGKDAAYQASNYGQAKSISYISLKINKGVLGSSTISIIGSGVNHISDYNNYALPSSSSNNVAFTISKLFNAGDIGKFTVDVSRSTTLAYRDLTPGTDDILNQRVGFDHSGSNLTEALSFGFNHHLDIEKEGLDETVYFNYSGLGYQNPGNNGFGGGGMKLGGNIKKALLKNKLTVSVRTDINNKPISYTSSDEWKSYQIQLDGRYSITKRINLDLKYMNGGTSKMVDDITSSVYSSQKLQLGGNIVYKIGKNYAVSHFTVGKQDYTNAYTAIGTNSSLLMVNYTQSLILRRNSLTATIFYNKELSNSILIGNMLNSDLTYQYTLFNKLNLSSGVTYLDNAANANQAGIKQSIQVLAGKHFDVDTYVDLRKNLITPLYPDLYATCRAELSFKYHL